MYGHDYAVPGTYEVTMVVAGRHRVFGEIVGTTKGSGDRPQLKPSPLGLAVLDEEIPKIHFYYPMVDVWQVCLMPDHLHMIVRINRPLPKGKHLGIIIGAFKGGVSRAWWRLSGIAEAKASDTVAGGQADGQVGASAGGQVGASAGGQAGASAGGQAGASAGGQAGASAGGQAGASADGQAGASASGQVGASASGQAGATVSAASAAEKRRPLFEPNYNDHILMRDGQLDNWKRYLRDNPLRYMMQREYPDLFRRALSVTIGETRYSAFGNLLLLRQPEKHQVFFHRRTEGVPTENTEFWKTESQRLISAANSGDVLVTPGISECEKRIKKMALTQRLRLIHLQADPIGRYWKPERSRFEACAYGTLLILAPWPEDMPAFASDYDRFHYLNHLAEIVCAISHTTSVSVQGLRLAHGG